MTYSSNEMTGTCRATANTSIPPFDEPYFREQIELDAGEPMVIDCQDLGNGGDFEDE
jgi:hypothetical protein